MHYTSTHIPNQSPFNHHIASSYPNLNWSYYPNSITIDLYTNALHGENVRTKPPLSANGLKKKPAPVLYKKHPYSILFHSTNTSNAMTCSTLQTITSYGLHKRLNVRKCSNVGSIGRADNKVLL